MADPTLIIDAEPDWKETPEVAYSFATVVQSSSRFIEQRRPLLEVPTRTVSCKFVLESEKAQKLLNVLLSGAPQLCCTPIYSEPIFAGAVTQGALSITAETDLTYLWNAKNCDYLILLDYITGASEMLKVSSVTGQVIALVAAIVGVWVAAQTVIYPGIASAIKEVRKLDHSSKVASFGVQFEEMNTGEEATKAWVGLEEVICPEDVVTAFTPISLLAICESMMGVIGSNGDTYVVGDYVMGDYLNDYYPMNSVDATDPATKLLGTWAQIDGWADPYVIMLAKDGTIYWSGSPDYCQWGNDYERAPDAVWTNLYNTGPVAGPTKGWNGSAWEDLTWKYISAGGWTVHAISTDGRMWSWGSNRNYQVGVNVTNHNLAWSYPVLISPGKSDWTKVSAGWTHSLAIDSEGKLWAWGDNGYGSCGLPHASPEYEDCYPYPVQVGAASNWVDCQAQELLSGAINSLGELYQWGYLNGYKESGPGVTPGNYNSPVNTSNGKFVSKFSLGTCQVIIIDSNGKLFGRGDTRIMGLGPTAGETYDWTPLMVDKVFSLVAIDDYDAVVYLDTTGAVWLTGFYMGNDVFTPVQMTIPTE